MSIRKLAQLAGTSPATISLVLNGKASSSRISSKTATRVLALAQQHNYRPDFFHASQQTQTIGVVFTSRESDFMVNIMGGIEDAIEAHHHHMLTTTCDGKVRKEAQHVAALFQKKVDGFIAFPVTAFTGEAHSTAHYERCVEHGVPLVFIDRFFPHIPCDRVLAADESSAYTVVTELIRRGCRQLGLVAPDDTATSVHDRAAGFQRAVAEAGLDVPGDRRVMLSRQECAHDGGRARIQALLTQQRPDAVFAIHEGFFHQADAAAIAPDTAFGFMFAEGQPLPDYPRCVGATQPHYQMGFSAAEILMQRISGDSHPPRTVRLPSRILTHWAR